MGLCNKYINKDIFYFIFRVFVGLLFMQHGFQKLFGMLEGPGIQGFAGFLGSMGFPAPTLFATIAGSIEFFGGLLIALGLFTRLASSLAAIMILIAYSVAHGTKGFLPILNGGELAILYFFVFIAITAFGARKWRLEKLFFKKEVF